MREEIITNHGTSLPSLSYVRPLSAQRTAKAKRRAQAPALSRPDRVDGQLALALVEEQADGWMAAKTLLGIELVA